jgi:hypothetical protein
MNEKQDIETTGRAQTEAIDRPFPAQFNIEQEIGEADHILKQAKLYIARARMNKFNKALEELVGNHPTYDNPLGTPPPVVAAAMEILRAYNDEVCINGISAEVNNRLYEFLKQPT